MDEAIRQRKFDQVLDEAKSAGKEIIPIDQILHNLPDSRFVFSTEEIDREILRRDRRLAVSIAAKPTSTTRTTSNGSPKPPPNRPARQYDTKTAPHAVHC